MLRRIALGCVPLLLVACVSNNSPPVFGGDDEDAALPENDASAPPGDSSAPDSSSHDATTNDAPTDSSENDATHEASVSDAPAGDSSPADSSPPDAGGNVTLLVTNDVGPEQGVVVLFHDATGTPIGFATTGANGVAAGNVPPAGGQVTAMFAGPNGNELLTFQGVQPGDGLTAFDDMNVAFPSATIDVTALPAFPDAGGIDPAQGVNAYVGSATAGSVTLPIVIPNAGYPNELDGHFSVLAAAYDVNGTEVAYTYADDVALTGSDAGVAITNPWSTTYGSAQLQVVNSADAAVPSSAANGVEVSRGVASQFVSANSAPNDGGETTTYTVHTGYSDSIQGSVTTFQVYSSTASYQAVTTRFALGDVSATPVMDLAHGLPAITATNLDTTEAGTPASGVVTWSSAAPLAAADGIIVALDGCSLAYADGGTASFEWFVVAPPTSTSVTTPPLPAGIGTASVGTGGANPAIVIAVDGTNLTGYRDLRQGLALLRPPHLESGSNLRLPVVPLGATVAWSALMYNFTD